MKNFSRTGKILFSYGAIQMFWGLVMLNVNLFEHTSETIKYIILIIGIVFVLYPTFLKNIKVILLRDFMLTYWKEKSVFYEKFRFLLYYSSPDPLFQGKFIFTHITY